MNIIIWATAAVCLILSAVICRFLKRWPWIFLGLLLSLPISFSSWLLVINTPQIARVGLGIIAVAPVLLIMMGFIDLVAALLGGIIGIIWNKKTTRGNL